MTGNEDDPNFVGPPRPRTTPPSSGDPSSPDFVGPPLPPNYQSGSSSSPYFVGPPAPAGMGMPPPQQQTEQMPMVEGLVNQPTESQLGFSKDWGLGKPEGFKNILPTLGAALTPSSGGEVISNTGNKILDSVYEFVGNNPYVTAGILTGAKSFFSLGTNTGMAPGTQVQTTLTGSKAFVVNTRTASRASVFVAKTAQKYRNPKIASQIIKGAIATVLGSKVFNLWADQEGQGGVSISRRDAKNNYLFNKDPGTLEVYRQIRAYENETLADEKSIIDSILSWTPIGSIKALKGFFEKTKQVAIYDDLLVANTERIIAQNDSVVNSSVNAKNDSVVNSSVNAKNDSVVNSSVNANNKDFVGPLRPQTLEELEAQQEQDSYKANIDYYNSERKKMIMWESNLRRQIKQAETEEERRFMEEQAAFWAKEKEKQRKLEAAERIATAEFWKAYRERKQEISANNAPSKLGFGLI